MMRIPRLAVLTAAFLIVLASCGGDDAANTATTVVAAAPTETSSTAAPETTTTAAPETTTTTAAPETTTTAPPETTTTAAAASPEDAAALVMAKTAAAAAAIPEDWTSTSVASDTDAADSDEIYGACAGEGAFDLADLDDATIAIDTVDIEGVANPTTFVPPARASIEARVFESAAVAQEAFGVLETVIGTDEGRDCLAMRFVDLFSEELPEDAEFNIGIEEVSVPGADVGARLILDVTADGITLALQFDLVAALDRDCTVYGTYFSFGEPVFDPDIRDAIFAAATNP